MFQTGIKLKPVEIKTPPDVKNPAGERGPGGDIFKNFIASFDSPWVQCYFDVGNHVKYAPPEEWIRTLGKLIVKIHIKDFKLNPDGRDGKFVHPRDGSVKLAVGAQGTRRGGLQRLDDD